MKTIIAFLAVLLCASYSFAQSSPWIQIDEKNIPLDDDHRYIIPSSYTTLKLDIQNMRKQLQKAPMSKTLAVKLKPVYIDIPWPDGSSKTFQMSRRLWLRS